MVLKRHTSKCVTPKYVSIVTHSFLFLASWTAARFSLLPEILADLFVSKVVSVCFGYSCFLNNKIFFCRPFITWKREWRFSYTAIFSKYSIIRCSIIYCRKALFSRIRLWHASIYSLSVLLAQIQNFFAHFTLSTTPLYENRSLIQRIVLP